MDDRITTSQAELTVRRVGYDMLDIRASRNMKFWDGTVPLSTGPDYFDGLLRATIKDLILREHKEEIEQFVLRGKKLIERVVGEGGK